MPRWPGCRSAWMRRRFMLRSAATPGVTQEQRHERAQSFRDLAPSGDDGHHQAARDDRVRRPLLAALRADPPGARGAYGVLSRLAIANRIPGHLFQRAYPSIPPAAPADGGG